MSALDAGSLSLGAALIAGFAGSGHCLSMCGGIAGALAVRNSATASAGSRPSPARPRSISARSPASAFAEVSMPLYAGVAMNTFALTTVALCRAPSFRMGVLHNTA